MDYIPPTVPSPPPVSPGGLFHVARETMNQAPPNDQDAERAVCGSCLIDPDAIIEIADFLTEGAFYRKAHGLIYATMLELYEAHEPIDVVTVAGLLEAKGELVSVGGASYLSSLGNETPTAIYVAKYAHMVDDLATLRGLINAAGKIAAIGYEGGDAEEAVDRAQAELMAACEKKVRKGFTHVRPLMHSTLDRLEEIRQNRGQIMGIPSGLRDLDELTLGFQPSDLIIIAARPGQGKTACSLQIAAGAAKDDRVVAFFSLEMGQEQLAVRLVSGAARVDGDQLRSGYATPDEFSRVMTAMGKLSERGLYFDDTPSLTCIELRTRARRLQMEQGRLDLVVVDYLQLMQATRRSKDGNRVQEVTEIAEGLKSLGKELHVPVIALSQLNRRSESSDTGEPRLSDLRECVTGDTLVWESSGRRVPISDLVGTNPVVWSVEKDSVAPLLADAVWKVGVRPVVRLTLASGRTLRATGNHKVLSGDGWTPVSSLSSGDRVAVANHIPEPLGSCDEWQDDRLILVAHLIGDGSFLPHASPRYTTSDEDNSGAVREAALSAFGITARRTESGRSWHQLSLSAGGNRWHPNVLVKWLRELGIYGQRSHQKMVPDGVFSLPNTKVALFLRHLWATDGCIRVGKGRGSVYYSTTSSRLAMDVAALLLRFGIVARVSQFTKTGYRECYSVTVSGSTDQRVFLDQIGSFGRRTPGSIRLRALLLGVDSNTNTDTLPMSFWDDVRTRMRELGVTQRKMASMRGTSYGGSAHMEFCPSRKTARSYADLLADPRLSQWVDKPFFWDRVLSVTPDGEEEVYDLTVPGTSNWVSDGVISHNSGALEQAADLVLLMWRDREQSEQLADGEIVNCNLAKHRNGPTGTMQFLFRKAQTRFESLSKREGQ